jgi:hypothetical protein
LLRSRLARRGLALSAALITAVFAKPAVAAVSHELLASTTRAATLAVSGVSLDEIVSPTTAKVVNDVLAGMSATSKFSIPTVVTLASILLIVTTGLWQLGTAANAANMFSFRRGPNVHGLTTTPVGTPAIGVSATGEGGCATSCGSAAATCGPAPATASGVAQ